MRASAFFGRDLDGLGEMAEASRREKERQGSPGVFHLAKGVFTNEEIKWFFGVNY